MWRRKRRHAEADRTSEPVTRLKDALRKARLDQAEHTGTVIDLRDAELARLELLDEALDPVFAEIPSEVDLFERGISRGESPRLWIDAVSHVAMGRDKRTYRFLQDTRYGRKVLAESVHVAEMVHAVTKYLAQRLIERERALAGNGAAGGVEGRRQGSVERRTRRRRAIAIFLCGLAAGVALLILAALLLES